MRKRNLFLLVSALFLLGLGAAMFAGCDGGGGSPGVSAYNFTSANMEDAARAGTDAITLFGPFTDVLAIIIGQFPPQVESVGPAAVIDLGDLGLCISGTSNLTWNDADDSGTLSAGDSVTLTLADCVVDIGSTANATIVLAFTAVTLAPVDITADVDLDITTVETVDSTVETERFTGVFTVQVSSLDGFDYTVVYTGADPDGLLTDRLNGTLLAKMGCFTVTQAFSALDPAGTFTLIANGVISTGGKIMTISTPGAPLGFVPGTPDPYPDSGALDLLGGGQCAAVGSPNLLTSPSGNYIVFTAVPGDLDDVTIELFDSSDTLLDAISTTWSALD
ncbi:MAG: hypothetical protein Kow0025_23600 [Thermodesulfovibrionales bacterium]